MIEEKVLECGNDTKKLFSLVNYLTGDVHEKPVPEHSTDEQLANDFADYIMQKIENIMKDLERYRTFTVTRSSSVHTMFQFSPLTEDKVLKLANKLATVTCELDK